MLISFSTVQVTAQCISIPPTLPVCPGSPVTLTAIVQPGCINGSGSYSFESIPWLPEPFTGGTPADPDMNNCITGNFGPHDDCYAGPYSIGFPFCFFNQSYSQFWIGSNGWLGFSDPAGHDWYTYQATNIPNPIDIAPKNCIFAPWEDWYPTYTGVNNVYFYQTGSPPDRKLVVYWKDCRIFSCRADPAVQGTFQIVLREQGNMIENHILERPACPPNTATQGVHNIDGSAGYTVPLRNNSLWNPEVVMNESTRFVPSGVTWYDIYPGGSIIGYGNQLTVIPVVSSTYYALYETCGNPPEVVSTTVNVSAIPDVIIDPSSSTAICSGQQADVLFSSNQAGTTFSWSGSVLPPGVTMGTTSGTGDIHQVIQNTGPNEATIVFSIVPTLNGCSAVNPVFHSVTVAPFLSMTFGPGSSSSICSGQQANIFFLSNIAGTTFSWNVTLLPAGITMNQTSGTGDVHEIITTSLTIPGMVEFSVTPFNPGCMNTSSSTHQVQVNPVPLVSFISCSENITIRNGRRIELRGGYPAGGVFSASEGVTFNGVTGTYEFDPSLVTGPFPMNLTIFYQFQNQWNCVDSKSRGFTIFDFNSDIVSPLLMRDLRDNKVYPFRTFGLGASQRQWMTGDLNYGTILFSTIPQTDNCSAEKYCHPNDPVCLTGGYYQWDELMLYRKNPVTQDLCPPGWHVPEEAEWQLLIDNFDPFTMPPESDALAGLLLKDPGNGFSAIPEGINYQNDLWAFTSGITATMFWTSSSSGANKAISRGLNAPYNPSISLYPASRSNAFPVRCIRN